MVKIKQNTEIPSKSFEVTVKKRRKKTGIDLALEDIKAGRLNRAKNVEDLMSQLMAD